RTLQSRRPRHGMHCPPRLALIRHFLQGAQDHRSSPAELPQRGGFTHSTLTAHRQMTMPSAWHSKTGVVLLDTREQTPEHEHAVHLKLADGLARLLGCPHVPRQQANANDNYYFVPTETLIDHKRYAALGILGEQDLFGGLVSYPHMATKAISH